MHLYPAVISNFKSTARSTLPCPMTLTMIWWSLPLTIPRSLLETAGNGQVPTCSILPHCYSQNWGSVHDVDSYHSSGIQVHKSKNGLNWLPSDNPSKKNQWPGSIRERGKPHLRLLPQEWWWSYSGAQTIVNNTFFPIHLYALGNILLVLEPGTNFPPQKYDDLCFRGGQKRSSSF